MTELSCDFWKAKTRFGSCLLFRARRWLCQSECSPITGCLLRVWARVAVSTRPIGVQGSDGSKKESVWRSWPPLWVHRVFAFSATRYSRERTAIPLANRSRRESDVLPKQRKRKELKCGSRLTETLPPRMKLCESSNRLAVARLERCGTLPIALPMAKKIL